MSAGAGPFAEDCVPPMQERKQGASGSEVPDPYADMSRNELLEECRMLREMLDAAAKSIEKRTKLLQLVLDVSSSHTPQPSVVEWHEILRRIETLVTGGK